MSMPIKIMANIDIHPFDPMNIKILFNKILETRYVRILGKPI